MILSTAYLGNIQYFSKLISGNAELDMHENYQKQSYRNRAEIMTASGVMMLTVPVIQPSGEKVKTKDIRIDNSKRWQHQHIQAIISAYRNSPYLDHYEEFFTPVYNKEQNFLADLNFELQEIIFNLINISPIITICGEFQKNVDPSQDFRNSISPKPRLQRQDNTFSAPQYYQVFAETQPFVENLSIIDLLFCEGPASADILRNTICRKD